MKKVLTALCCCAMLTQSVVAQETATDNKKEWKKQDTKQGWEEKGAETTAKQKYVGCTKIVGEYIYGTNDEQVGDFNSVTLDKEGNILQAIVGVGGLGGVGETEIAVPWEAFSCECKMEDGKKSCRATLPMTAEQLKEAPALEKEEYAELYDKSWLQKNAKFYGVQSESMAPEMGSMMCVTDIAGLQLSGTKAMNKMAASDANQKTYTSSDKDEEVDLGTIEEVVIDLDEAKVTHVILGDDSGMLSEKHVAIPFSKVNFSKDDNEVCAKINATAKDIEAAPKLTPGEYQELDEESVRMQVDNSFSTR